MIKAIIFDWGGVLGEENNKVAARKLSPIYGCDEKILAKKFTEEEYLYSSGQDASPYYENLSKTFNIPADVIRTTLNEVKSWDVLEYAKSLQKKYKIYLLSNQIASRTREIRKNEDLRFFEETFFSDELKMQKPNPKIFEFVLNKIHLLAEQCLFIDDREDNIEQAAKQGMKTIRFENLQQLKKEIEKIDKSQ